jgi:Transposase DDE domain group 1
VVAKAEHLAKGANPRFVVTSLSAEEAQFPAPSRWRAQSLYEEFYCARGDMENRIKEQMMLFADRTSTSWIRSNQIRLYFSTVAYQLLQALRRLGLAGTELAKAQCGTVRLKLLKIGGLVRITVRKIWVSLSAGYPYVELFRQVQRQLQAFPIRC